MRDSTSAWPWPSTRTRWKPSREPLDQARAITGCARSYPSVRDAGTAVIRGQPVQGCEALHPSYIEETKPSTGRETATSDTERRIP